MNEVPPTVEVTACSVCRRSSTWHAAFTRVKDGSVSRLCCPACAARLHRRKNRVVTGTIAAAVVVFLWNHFASGSDGVGLFLFGMTLVYAFQMPLVLFHEAGHVVAARIARAAPYAVIAGHEPWLLDRNVWGMRLRIGLLIGGGVVFHEACEGANARLRAILITMAGPLVNLAIAIAAFAIFESVKLELEGPITGVVLVSLGVASAFQFIVNLWPHVVETPSGNALSDGGRILSLLKGVTDDATIARGARHHADAWFAWSDGEYDRSLASCGLTERYWTAPPLSLHAAVLRSAVLIDRGDVSGAIVRLRSIPIDAQTDPGIRAIVLNNLACALLLTDEPERLEEGLTLVGEAFQIAPWERSIGGTRACLLGASADAANTRAAEARALIETLGERGLSKKQRAWTLLARGLVAAAEGSFAAARAFGDEARSLDVGTQPLRLLERRIPSP